MTIISLYFPILIALSLSFFLSFFLPATINLFKKNIHSFLGFPSVLHTSNTTTVHHPISSLAGGSGLITATIDVCRSPNVLESATLKPNPPPASLSVDGLMSCTESLGFESSNFDDQIDKMDNKKDIDDDDDNEKDIDDDDDNKKDIDDDDNKKDIDGDDDDKKKDIDGDDDDNKKDDDDDKKKDIDDDDDDDDGGEVWRMRKRMAESRGNWRNVGNFCYEKKVVMRSYPPPLSSLNRNGQPSFFLRPVRKDGRLELTEVRIHRPEILHASRHDGRLTLHLIPNQSILEEEEQEAAAKLAQEEEEEEELVQEEEAQLEGEELVEEEVKEEIVVEEEEKEGEAVEEIRYWKEEERVIGDQWRFLMRGNEGFRRCHEMVNQHHHVHGSHHHLRMCGVSIV